MRATVYHGPSDMRIDQVPDPIIQAPTDVVARITHAGICGSDLWSYRGIDQREPGDRMGHDQPRAVWYSDQVQTFRPSNTPMATISMRNDARFDTDQTSTASRR